MLNKKPVQSADYVLYWMQQSARVEENHALEYAIHQANALGVPVVVVFGLMDDYPEANVRHYKFLLEGLQAVYKALLKRRICFYVYHAHPAEAAKLASKNAAMLVCDVGYTRHQRAWRTQVAEEVSCACVQVESDVVVPVEVVSNKAEYAARTIRPKIGKHLDDFLLPYQPLQVEHSSLEYLPLNSLPIINIADQPIPKILNDLKLDRHVSPVDLYIGGEVAAQATLNSFLENCFVNYAKNRNQPQTNDVSHMSKYLHFGHISPLAIARAISAQKQNQQENSNEKTNSEVYLEELIVRRELAINFIFYTKNYDSYDCLPAWAQTTLQEHADDEREYLYSLEQLETAQTHDPYWNAAMNEMRYTGFMHNYMRMYWGKKILEWSPSPQEAYSRTLKLNNAYFLDGRDANSYAGVAWIFGQHDRPWFEREVFGKVRYMNANGLKRKAKPDEYVKKVASLMAGNGLF